MRFFVGFILGLFLLPAYATLSLVAAENFYGEVAAEIGGPYVQVTNVLNSPIQDPHLFSPQLTQAKLVADADIVVYNGAGYDGWMKKLLAVSGKKSRSVLIVTESVPHLSNNPHIWYDPQTMPAYAKQLTNLLMAKDPIHSAYFQAQLSAFLTRYQQLTATIDELKIRFAGRKIIATEPLFDDMAGALSLQMLGHQFALSVMNETTPSPSQIQTFIMHINHREAHALIYNLQVSSPLIDHMKTLAQAAQIPLVGVSELMPPKMSYIQWMTQNLIHLKEALNDNPHH